MTLALAGVVRAQSAAEEGMRDTIRSQLDAFLAEDVERAFSHASPGIRDIFRTPENFGRMVREGYPMVWRPGRVDFLELREIDGAQWQKVMIRDAEGRPHVLDYRMEPDGQGGWKIDGVRILPAPDLAA
ncbi:MAG: DUF4864 domain-containing protein [Paracoccaceae bacterium]